MERFELLVKSARLPDGRTVDLAVKDGKIARLAPSVEGEAEYVVNADGKLLFPSFVNAHTHLSMTLFRGIGADLPLMDWLQKVIWPLEQRFVSPEFVYDGALLGILELIKSGCTLFLDMYFFEESVARACEETGVRGALGVGILDFPTKVASSADEYLEKVRRFASKFKNSPYVMPVVAPHAPYTCSPETLRRTRELADELGLYLHIHLSETENEVKQILSKYGKRPVELLDEIGFLDERVIAAHVVWTDEREREILRERKVSVAHCPESNLKLGSGVAPVPDYLKRGINVCLGTDGAASNDNLNLLEEASTCAKLHKGYLKDPTALTAPQVLKMATENGFKALGLKAGRIEEGYEADFILINPDVPEMQPLYDPVAQLIYSATSEAVDTVVCKGKVLMEKREVKVLDEEEVFKKARAWREKILRAL
ncbi:MAG: amidohydrolase [Aquificae bacterium]|nr:amidohydrolase [Aquificota bacterium]